MEAKEYHEDFRIEDGILCVRLTGKFPNKLLKSKENLFQPLIDACKAHKCSRALIDARNLQVDFGTMAMFRAGEDAAFLNRVGLRVALLAREDAIDPFFEDVVTNRGGSVGIFTDLKAASDWLEM